MSRIPSERPHKFLKVLHVMNLTILITVMVLHYYYVFSSSPYDSTNNIMVTDMTSQPQMISTSSTQNQTLNGGNNEIKKEQGETVTRKNVMRIMKKMYDGNLINRNYFVFLLRKVKIQLQSLDTIYDVPIEKSSYNGTRVTVVGDIHGQFHTMLHIFQVNGWPNPNHVYIFNGDYTDKGQYSIENLSALILFKLYCPECIHFTRGNHETEFFLEKKVKGEIINHYDVEVYGLVVEVIHEIPLAITLSNEILVIHAGINSEHLTIEDIRGVKRGMEPEMGMLLQDLLWCDPMDRNGIVFDPARGTFFGPDVSKSFLERNNLKLMIRAHTSEKEGYKVQHNDKVITVWSAPNRPNVFEKGSYLNIDEELNWKIKDFDLYPTISDIEDWGIL